MNISGNTILLTGGTSGIGKALLTRLLDLQNKVVVSSSNPSNLARLQEQYPQIHTIPCDLGDAQALERLIDQVHFELKDINILINNAGIQYNDNWLDGDKRISDHINRELQVNLNSPLQLINGLLPLLLEKPEAAIINVSSALAFVPKQSAPVYCGSKAGLHIFTKALRYQLVNSPVKVFEIIPPLVDTPMTTGRGNGKITPEQLVDEFMKAFAKDRYEVSIGKTKLLRTLQRLAPGVADGMLKDS